MIPIAGLWGRGRCPQFGIGLVVAVDHDRCVGIKADVSGRVPDRQAPQVVNHIGRCSGLLVVRHHKWWVGGLPKRRDKRVSDVDDGYARRDRVLPALMNNLVR
jgi:hypothetical protein